MINNIIPIESKKTDYSFDYLTCFEKPMGLLLSTFGKRYEKLFYLYLKLFQSYNTKTFGSQELYIFDLNSMFRWIIETPLQLQLNLIQPASQSIHDVIEPQVDKGLPVLITINLKELFYSRHYHRDDWSFLLLINGYDRKRRLYSVMDTVITESDSEVQEGQLYKHFFLPYSLVERLYDSYREAYGAPFVGYVENIKNRPLDITSYLDCFSLYLHDLADQPFKEKDYINEITLFVEKGVQIKAHGIDDATSEIDFVFTRTLKYKEVFFRELHDALLLLNRDQDRAAELGAQTRLLLNAWSKIKNKSIICYRINAPLNAAGQLADVYELEKVVRETVRQIKEAIEESRNDLDQRLIAGELQYGNAGFQEGPAEPRAMKRATAPYVAPHDEMEKKLAGMWQAVLKKDQIGIQDNFFDLGGHSLSMVRLVAMIIKEFNVEVPIENFFQAPYVKNIVRYIKENAGNAAYAPIPSAPERACYPLSAAQKRLFVIDQLNPNSVTYNVTMAMEIDAPLDPARVEWTFNQLVRRHEVLRSCFCTLGGIPYQNVSENLTIKVDYRRPTENAAGPLIEEFVRPFDLTRLPLLRVLHIRLEEKTLLVFDAPHIIIDGVSVGILIREFTELYGRNQELRPLTLQYKDYALWQGEMMNSPAVRRQEDYWLSRFRGEIPLLNLPLDYPRPALQNYEGDTLQFTIDRSLAEKVYTLSKKTETTLYMVLFAVFNVLLHKYTGQEDVIVGTPLSDRPHVDLHEMIGMFVNMMPVRTFPSPAKTFETFLNEVKQISLEVYKNQDCQFNTLVEKLGLKGNVQSNPLFNVAFVLQNIDLKPISVNGLTVRPRQVKHKISHFDMVFEVFENSEKGIDVTIEFSTALFRKNTVERFGKSFVTILDHVTACPEGALAGIKPLSDEEQRRVLVDFNDTFKPYDKTRLIHQLFEDQVKKQPNAVAVEYTGRRVTYQELNERANALAVLLRERGVAAGAFVAVILDRSFEMIISVMGILKAGGAYVPLEPYLPEERIGKIVKDLNLETVITDANHFAKVSGIVENRESVRNIFCMDLYAPVSADLAEREGTKNFVHVRRTEKTEDLPPLQTSDDIAYVIFTSGSTGVPKGVVVTHKPVINLIEWVNSTFAVGPEDRLLFVTSLSFDLSVYDIFGILSAGGTILLKSHDEIREPSVLVKSVIEEGVTFWDSAPPALQPLIPYFAKLRNKTKSKLRLVFLSGDWISVTLPDELRETFAGVNVISLGGATEATVWSNYYPVGNVEPHWVSIPYGKPIQNAKYYILDQSLNPCSIGVAGDLYIGGACLASGYINDPELTASRFIEHPFEKGKKIYKTGDLARWFEDGNMEFLGRADQQVKIRGFRIELGEIESTLRKHELIKEAAVLAKGQQHGEKHLFAYFAAEKQFTMAEIKEFLLQQLPDYMVPSHFVQIDNLPLTSNGKLDRKALAALGVEPINNGMEYVSPSTDLEVEISGIFEEALGLKIGLNDNFFDVGASSITIIEVISKLNAILNKDITVIKMFQYPTVRAFAEYLTEATVGGAANERAVPEQVKDDAFDDSLAVFERNINLIQNQ
jgi:tyrocidine synthetase III